MSASVGEYAIFGGGYTGSGSYTNPVEAYNKSLTKSVITPFKNTAVGVAATCLGDYAIFLGGRKDGNSSRAYIDHYYDKSLT